MAWPTQPFGELYDRFGFWDDDYVKSGLPAKSADLVVQLDPERSYKLGKLQEKKAVQLGLKGRRLREYGQERLLWVEDITAYVAEQQRLWSNKGFSEMEPPTEEPYARQAHGASGQPA